MYNAVYKLSLFFPNIEICLKRPLQFFFQICRVPVQSFETTNRDKRNRKS